MEKDAEKKEQFVIIATSATFLLGETTLVKAVGYLRKVREGGKDAQLFRQTEKSGAQLVSEEEMPLF